jgi:CheY-like chemotaxis protein
VDVCLLIRERWPDTLIVFVTANVSKIPDDFSGAHGVIAKPFSHAGLVNAIKYLAAGVLEPPPSLPLPTSLVPSANLQRRWAAA